MLIICLAVSAVLLGIVNALILQREKSRDLAAFLVSGAACGVTLGCLGHPLLALNAGLLCLVVVVWAMSGARRRWFLASSLGVTLAAYCVFGLLSGVPEVRKWEQAKSAYPMESLADRLAYEDRPHGGAGTATHDPDRVSHFEDRVKEAAENGYANQRVRGLQWLHAGAVAQFANSPGFGTARMVTQPSPGRLEIIDQRQDLQALDAIPQSSRPYDSSESTAGAVRVGESQFSGVHEANALTFLDPFDFGYARDRNHVAGFRPHRFRRAADAPIHWNVERLELVGLLKYDAPVVYLSENLPKMDELRNAPTRRLDAFEQEALAALRRGEDLMAVDGPERMRMLGSLRAVKQCVGCHHVERGELLGAFSYKLARDAGKN